MNPPGWYSSRRGGHRRRLGPAELFISRRRGERDYYIGINLRADVTDPAEAAALAEALAEALIRPSDSTG